jgi:hypothetical protein
MPEADDDVEADPEQGKPTRPVVSAKEEDSGDDGEDANEFDPQGVVLEQVVWVEFGKVIDEADGAREDEEQGHESDGERTGHGATV